MFLSHRCVKYKCQANRRTTAKAERGEKKLDQENVYKNETNEEKKPNHARKHTPEACEWISFILK